MKIKRCTKCNEIKPLDELVKEKACKDGRRNLCKICLNKTARERYANDPEYRKKRNKQSCECTKKRRANDPEFRKKENKRSNEFQNKKYANDPEYRKKRNKQSCECTKKRRANDPEFRKKDNKRSNEFQNKKYANDPEYRKKILKRGRENKAINRREKLTTGLNILINEIQKGVS